MGSENTQETPHEIASDNGRSNEIEAEDRHGQVFIPGMAPVRRDRQGPGPVEVGVRAQVDALRAQEVLHVYHEGIVALAVATAQEIDMETTSGGKAYGKAQLITALNSILENLPQVDTAGTDELDAALQGILEGDD